MGSNYFLVIKRIGKNKKPYYYRQRVWKEGKKTRTHSVYIGPVDKLNSTILTKMEYGQSNYVSDKLKGFFEGKTADEITKLTGTLTDNARYPTGVYSRAQFIEETVKENQAFLGRTPEEKAYYDHLMTEAIHGPGENTENNDNEEDTNT